MPSDLLEDVTDHNGNSVFLEMKASGHAILSILGEDTTDDENSRVEFHLMPNETGLRLAEQIEDGLRAWREQVDHLRQSGIVESR